MSDTDTFIDEVTEEVRRDHLFKMMRKYGWIAVVLIVLIVGGASFNEYRKASTRAAAESLGDSVLAAMARNDASMRASELSRITADTPGGAAILQFLVAAAQADAEEIDQAVASLQSISRNGDVPEIYRQIASFKALTLQANTLSSTDLRQQFEALAQPGARLRLLAEEQLALIDVAEGQIEPALTRLQSILQDAEADTTLRQRVARLIVSLGGEPVVLTGVQG